MKIEYLMKILRLWILRLTHLGLQFACCSCSLQSQVLVNYKLRRRTCVPALQQRRPKKTSTNEEKQIIRVSSAISIVLGNLIATTVEYICNSLTFSFKVGLNVWLRL